VANIKQNTLRKRADKLPEVTDKMWNEVIKVNREVYQDYIDSNQQLSKETLKQYKSASRQFFWWVKMRCQNKPIYQIKKSDFLKYRSYLINHGLSSSALNLKKSCISSICNFAENMYDSGEDYPDYVGFRNFTRGLPPIPKNKVYEKIKVSEEEYKDMMRVLEEQKDYLGMAWLACAFNVGARRSEIIQFKTEILDYEHHINSKGEKQNYRFTHVVRGKGRSRDGKPIRFMLNDEAYKYLKLWVTERSYEHEYIFTVKYGGDYVALSKTWANSFCQNKLSPIAGRRINPHLFKASCITWLLESGKDIKVVSKYVAQHESVETTQLYDLRSDEDARDGIFD